MTLIPDHPDDIAEMWTERFARCDTHEDAWGMWNLARAAGLDQRLCLKLRRQAEARANALEALREAVS